MPATKLDPSSALIVIDLQKGLMDFPFAHPLGDVVNTTRTLLDAFRAADQAVVLVNAAGVPGGRTDTPRPDFDFPEDWTDLIPELDARPHDLIVTKSRWGAFLGTDLEFRLKSAGVTQVVLAGVATSMGVESTAREAYSQGFNVTLAVDAMTDLSAEAHANSVSRIFPHIGETSDADGIIGLLGNHRS